MADEQVIIPPPSPMDLILILSPRIKERSRDKALFSKTPQSYSETKIKDQLDISRMQDLVSKHLKQPKLKDMLIKNVPSLRTSPSEEESSSKSPPQSTHVNRVSRGMVISTKMKNTVIVRRDYLHYVKKYNRFEKRHSNVAVHASPCFRIKEGDIVVAGQCRPLSKTVRFNVLKLIPNKIIGSVKKQFVLF